MELSFLGASAEVGTLQARTTVESGIHCAKSSTMSALCSSCVNTKPCSGVLAGFCLRGSHSVVARCAHRKGSCKQWLAAARLVAHVTAVAA